MLLDEVWYPMRIEFLEDTRLVRAIQVQKYDVNARFSDDEFDVRRIRSAYPSASTTQRSATESESMSDVQKTIEEFKKIFE
jgi:hypothetical protein